MKNARVLLTRWMAFWLAVVLGSESQFAQTSEPVPPLTIVRHGECREKFGNDACWGFAVRPKIPVYSQPSAASRILDHYSTRSMISLLEPTENKIHTGWVSVAVLDRGQHVVGWIRHADIVLTTDLRRVTGCWAVNELNWDEEASENSEGGEYRLRFNVDGKILPGKRGAGQGANNTYFANHFGIFYARGVTMIRHLSEPKGDRPTLAPIFVLDYPNRNIDMWFNVSPPMDGTQMWRLSPNKQLKGCTQIPRVNPNDAIKFK